MPTAALHPCHAPRCAALTPGRYCPDHAQPIDNGRATAHARGYTRSWHRFRRGFVATLANADIMPCCGAALPGGPTTLDSRCKTEGRLTFTSEGHTALHLDHEPPLMPHERADMSAVCDPMRVQLLCSTCHAGKTNRQGGS